LVRIDEILEMIAVVAPIEAVHTMQPDDVGVPPAWTR